jgi:putative tryptophan/tyrosine transport system substrate-binding protein
MKRREFIGLVGGAAVAWPIAARAERAAKVWRISMLDTAPREFNRTNLDAFIKRLRELGYVEGQNLTIEYRASDGDNERIGKIVSELVSLRPDLVAIRGTQETLAMKEATSTIPIVMCGVADPVRRGLAASLSHPGGNITGLNSVTTEIETKRVALLKEVVPGMKRMAMMGDFRNPAVQNQWKEVQIAAQTLAIDTIHFDVRSRSDLNYAFELATTQNMEAVRVGVDATTRTNRKVIIELAEKYRMPVIYAAREFADDGGLISYAPDYANIYSRCAAFVDKIFKGAAPAELPIELPTKFELILNLRTAKVLGLTITPTVLSLADEVIE